jgi:hypothetical protein
MACGNKEFDSPLQYSLVPMALATRTARFVSRSMAPTDLSGLKESAVPFNFWPAGESLLPRRISL